MLRDRETYEHALIRVFGLDSRDGKLVDADRFDHAKDTGDWRTVQQGLRKALKTIEKNSKKISWSEEDKEDGGSFPNFTHSLEEAISILEQKNDIAKVYWVVCDLIIALNAVVKKK